MKQLNFLKRKFLIILGLMGVFLHSCQYDDFYDQDKTSSKSIKVQRLKFSDLQKYPKVLEKIETLTNRKSNYQARMVEIPQYNFTVDTDEIIFIEADTLLSYTFRIYRDDDNELLENLVLKPSENGSSYDAFLFQYDFSEEDIELYQNGQPIPNQQEKTQITYLPDFDETPLYNARVGENGAPPFEAPSGCAWELIDYDFASDGYYWEAIHYWQLNCNGGGSGSSSGDGSSNGGWTGSGNTGTSPGNGNSNGNQNGGGRNNNGNNNTVSPIVTIIVGADEGSKNDPCINAINANNKSKATFNETAFQYKVNQINTTLATDTVEKGFAFGIKTDDNSFTTSEIITGTATTSVVLPVTAANYNVTGNVHTHPVDGFDSFSPMDFYGFHTSHTANSNFSTMFVLGANGEVYSLTITDPMKFTNFAGLFPLTDHFDPITQGWKKGSPIEKAFMDALRNFRDKGKSWDEAYALANAYVLRKYNAGMSISKKDSNGDFKTLFVEEKKDPNDDTKTIYEQTPTCNLKKKI